MDQRESMEFDIVIVGAGPAGLATACHIRQLCHKHEVDLSVCLIEKGSEIGAHVLSGAIIETDALSELFPNWRELEAPLNTQVHTEQFHFLINAQHSLSVPNQLLPKSLKNHGNYIASLGNLCRWLGQQAEALGVEIFSGFSASEILYDDDKVIGIATGDMGLSRQGEQKENYEPGYELLAKYTVFAEGCRGHLGKELIKRYQLDKTKSPQHYALGLKEIWQVPEELHHPGKVLHGLGWPLGFKNTTGGWFLYHLDSSQIAVGLITDLNYRNPWLDPYEEFQRLKQHPLFKNMLSKSTRIAYGARTLVKGGIQSLPQLYFPGGILVGDEAGFLNFAKLKGSHTAIKSGILAAESIVEKVISNQKSHTETFPPLESYQHKFTHSWLYKELHQARNVMPAFHKWGTCFGTGFNFIDQKIFSGHLPFTLHDDVYDHKTLKTTSNSNIIHYAKPDNIISFDRASSVFLSNTNHSEDQPCHLKLLEPKTPVHYNLPNFAEPALRYCPAGVYEIVDDKQQKKLQINAQNCLHCKACDIKDPSQNIQWVTPEGCGGPNYSNM